MMKENSEKPGKLAIVVFYEANLSANNIISFIKDLLLKMKLEIEDFSFSLSDTLFDINDENTWSEGFVPVGKLFYNLMEDLINKSKITKAELEELKTKEYTKSLFCGTDYPAVANHRTGNMATPLARDIGLNRYGLMILIFTFLRSFRRPAGTL